LFAAAYVTAGLQANSHIADVTDRAALRLLVVTCLIALNRKAEAIPIVEDLLFSNPDNQAYCLLYGNCFSASVDKAGSIASYVAWSLIVSPVL
jgi:predicted Zn-dependent protease